VGHCKLVETAECGNGLGHKPGFEPGPSEYKSEALPDELHACSFDAKWLSRWRTQESNLVVRVGRQRCGIREDGEGCCRSCCSTFQVDVPPWDLFAEDQSVGSRDAGVKPKTNTPNVHKLTRVLRSPPSFALKLASVVETMLAQLGTRDCIRYGLPSPQGTGWHGVRGTDETPGHRLHALCR
jgi:hypothetical protein